MDRNITRESLISERDALLSRLQYLERELKKRALFESLSEAQEGETLIDGSVLIYKWGDYAILAAPADTEVHCCWDDIPNLFSEKLEKLGFYWPEWFVPDSALLKVAFRNATQAFSLAAYWTSEEASSEGAWCFHPSSGEEFVGSKVATARVRAFKVVFL